MIVDMEPAKFSTWRLGNYDSVVVTYHKHPEAGQ
jgi:hypothetical protein